MGFLDEDENEVFYTCVWGRLEPEFSPRQSSSGTESKRKKTDEEPEDTMGSFYVAFAGQRGIIITRSFSQKIHTT